MTATFFRHGQGRSINARSAESNGRHPMTRATTAVAAEAGCTHKRAKEALLASWDGEWHHVGKFASRCNYYSVEAAIEWLAEEARLGGDTLREEVEVCEWAEACLATHDDYVGFDISPCYAIAYLGSCAGYLREGSGPGTVGEARVLAYCGDGRVNQIAERAREAASFRRWEPVLRRLALKA